MTLVNRSLAKSFGEGESSLKGVGREGLLEGGGLS